MLPSSTVVVSGPCSPYTQASPDQPLKSRPPLPAVSSRPAGRAGDRLGQAGGGEDAGDGGGGVAVLRPQLPQALADRVDARLAASRAMMPKVRGPRVIPPR
jgi:hypothetical protein